MRIWIYTLIVAVFGCSALVGQEAPQDKPKPQDKNLAAKSFKTHLTQAVELDYLVFLPKGYSEGSTNRWPLIFFLHGAGERGTNVWRVSFHGPAKYILQNPDFPFIMIAPQCRPDEIWSNESLLALLENVQKKYKIDASRIYLTGLSMGGYGTWELGTAYPEKFAAIAPICGGGRRIHVVLAARGYAPEKLKSMQSMGVWAFHGAKDTVVPPEESELMLEALKLAKVAELKFTVYPEAGHDSWTETYNNPELYEWFLKHQRASK